MATSNNFKLTATGGGLYIAKSGHDSNAGTSADEPKKSLAVMDTTSGNLNIIGAGVYNEALSSPIGSTTNIYAAQGDGYVIINLGGAGVVSSRWSFTDLTIKNGIYNSTDQAGSSGGLTFGFTTCFLENITGTHLLQSNIGNQKRYIDTILFNCSAFANIGSSAGYKLQYRGCIMYGGSGIFQASYLVNCYVGAGLVAQFNIAAAGAVPTQNDTFSGSANNLCNCNIQGVLRLPITGGWKDYAVQDQYIGTPQANGYAIGVNWLNEANLTADGFVGTIVGWNTLVTTLMNRDPKFNDASARNFTLQSNSPHFKAAYGGSANIGSTNSALSVKNTDTGTGTITVLPGTGIDTSVPDALKLSIGFNEAYVDYMFYQSGTAKKLQIVDDYYFDSDQTGNTPLNNNVPDAEPLTANYAGRTTTTATGSTTTVKTPTGLITAGQYIRVDGEVRLVASVTPGSPDTVTVGVAFRAIVGTGIAVTYGTQAQIAAINPNRLTVLMRTSNNAIGSVPNPATSPDWDNNVSAGFGVTGTFFNQAIGKQPQLIISGGVVYGAGDSNAPTGITPQDIGNCWIQMRVYIRNNYSSVGL